MALRQWHVVLQHLLKVIACVDGDLLRDIRDMFSQDCVSINNLILSTLKRVLEFMSGDRVDFKHLADLSHELKRYESSFLCDRSC